MSVSRLAGIQLVVFCFSSIPVALFDNHGIDLQVSQRIVSVESSSAFKLCFILRFICDLFVAHNDSWMS